VSPAPFEVESEQREDGIHSIAVRGELDMSTAPELEAEIDRVLAGEDVAVMLDLSACEFIDSTGIALIVRTWQRLDGGADGGGEGRLVLCCVNSQVRRLLKITGVETSISMHERPDAALAELQAASG
jgi:anti-sigma B factor antagonist